MYNRLVISDPHFMDRDLKRADRHGVRGIDLLWSFVWWLTHREEPSQLFILGDCFNFLRVLAEDLKAAAPIFNMLARSEGLVDLVILAGNHDPMEGVEFLGYSQDKVELVLAPRDFKDGVARAKEQPVIMTHGDIFDPFWNPENRKGKAARFRLCLGQEIIKRGHQAEKVHPLIEDVIMGGLEGLFLKRGDRLPHESFISQAVELALSMGSREILTGHLHDLFDLTRKGVRVVNLNSWVPSHKESRFSCFTRGFLRNQILPGVYDLDEGQLLTWTYRGLETQEGKLLVGVPILGAESPF